MAAPARPLAVALTVLSLAACTWGRPTPVPPTPTATAPEVIDLPTLAPGDVARTISPPKTLGGKKRIVVPQFDVFAQSLKDNGAQAGITDAFYAGYGRAKATEILLTGITLNRRLPAHVLDAQLVADLLTQISFQDVPVPKTPADAVPTTVGGYEYSCFITSPNAVDSGLCVWGDGNVIGLVLDLGETDLAAVATVAAEARSTAEH